MLPRMPTRLVFRPSAALLVAALVVPATLVLPVTTAPAAQPHPVRPHVQQIRLGGIDAQPDALPDRVADRVAGRTAVGATPAKGRLAVLSAPLAADPFRLVGLSWAPGSAPTAVQVRTRTAGAWSAWIDLEVTEDVPDVNTPEGRRARPGVEPLLAPGSDGVQVRVDTVSGRPPADLRVALVDPGESAADAAIASVPPASASAAASTPAIVTRAQWGADESLTDPISYTSTIKVGFVHHTASSNSYWQRSGWTQADAARDIRSIYAYYTGSMGYADLPYNFLVDMSGRIYEGRHGGVDKPVLGAHTGGFNTDTFAVSALGNLDTASPSSAMVDSIARVMAWKLDLHHRDPLGRATLTSTGGGTSRYAAGVRVTVNAVSGHRDVGATACPGRYLYPPVSTIRARARSYQKAALYNPVASATTVQVGSPVSVSASVPAAQSWTLTVQAMCLGGASVRTVNGAASAAGTVTAVWDGKTSTGVTARPGRYTLVLASASATLGAARPVTAVVDVLPADGSSTGLVCDGVTRVAGRDRYATSVEIGRRAAPEASTVVLASGEPASLVDGLVAAPLAGSRRAPLLLTQRTSLPAVVAAELKRRAVSEVVVVGGTAAVSLTVEGQLRALGARVTRLSGTDRFGTAAAVARAIGPTRKAVVASGSTAHLVDALAAGGPATALGRPILLVDSSSIPPVTRAALADLGVDGVTVVGGPAAVSASVVAQLPGASQVAGADRYATSAAIASAFLPWVAADTVVVASGTQANMVDALPGGTLDRLTLLTTPQRLATATRSWVAGHSVQKGTVLGGVGAVSDSTLIDLAMVVGL